MSPEQIARHEAGHAVAALALGIPVRLIDVAGDASSHGRVRHAAERITDRVTARKRMVLILCGPLESAASWDDVPSWPLDPGRSTDECNLAVLAEWLGLDEAGYNQVLDEAVELTLTPEYLSLHTAVTGLLDYQPRVGPELLDRLRRFMPSEGC